MDSTLWAKAHAATAHFPLALTLSSAACDLAATALGERACARELRSAGYWSMLGAAAGSVPAVLIGVLVTKGKLLGHGAMRMHHLFVWPAFGLLVALATWRLLVGTRGTGRGWSLYLLGVAVVAGLISAAGYWGGELASAA